MHNTQALQTAQEWQHCATQQLRKKLFYEVHHTNDCSVLKAGQTSPLLYPSGRLGFTVPSACHPNHSLSRKVHENLWRALKWTRASSTPLSEHLSRQPYERNFMEGDLDSLSWRKAFQTIRDAYNWTNRKGRQWAPSQQRYSSNGLEGCCLRQLMGSHCSPAHVEAAVGDVWVQSGSRTNPTALGLTVLLGFWVGKLIVSSQSNSDLLRGPRMDTSPLRHPGQHSPTTDTHINHLETC